MIPEGGMIGPITEDAAVIAAGGLGTRLKDFKDNKHTKVLIDINELSMISTQIKQLKSWGFENFIVIEPGLTGLQKNQLLR